MTTDVVTTYYQPVKWHGDQRHSIDFWAASWEKLGWQTRVLGRSDAMRHPLAQRYLMKMGSIPVQTPAGYELACWLRWLAFSVNGGGLMVDFDVINKNLPSGQLISDEVLIADAHRVPCMVFATSDGAEDIVQRIFKHTPPDQPHYSDMMFFQQSPYPHASICREIGQDGWREAPVRHFSVRGCRQYNLVSPNKLSVMQDVLSKE